MNPQHENVASRHPTPYSMIEFIPTVLSFGVVLKLTKMIFGGITKKRLNSTASSLWFRYVQAGVNL